MENFDQVKKKLEQFITKYHTNELIKGVILFVAIGVLYFLITVSIESFLWLGKTGRTILFWLFILVEAGLFFRFIVYPVAKLFKVAKGINFREASSIIGKHFPEVNDKLINVLQLSEQSTTSSLLLASIDQKSLQLKPVPFRLAVNFRNNLKYLKYAMIPVAIIALLFALNKTSWISDGYSRVVNYQTAYQPPAPFQFFVLNPDLKGLENENFVVKVRVAGDIVPDNVSIEYNEEIYFLKNTGSGEFEYTFIQPKNPLDFVLSANDVTSQSYTLDIVAIPALLNFDMKLNYPNYTGKKNEVLNSSGNATIPEGTKVEWVVHTRNTDGVSIRSKDSVASLSKDGNDFSFKKTLYNNWDYTIATSNSNVKDYENLSFGINVIKDQYPEMILRSEKDSLDNQKLYFFGRVSDDYGLTGLNLVYYNIDKEDNKIKKNIPVSRSLFDEFVYSFPGDLNLDDGVDYEFYFEVVDNDVVNRFKTTKSQVFNFRKLTNIEREDNRLQKQNNAISGLNKSLEKFKDQEKELDQLSKLQKEKKELDFNDKRKLEEFLKRQKEQERMMRDFSKELKENLDEIEDKKEEEPFKDALKERLERNEEKLKKNEKLLEEIEKLSEKIKKEELTEKLEELSKENKNIKKNLEQLLELTKRFYVIEKHEKLAEALENLADKQEELSEKEDQENTPEKQEELNKQFDKFQEEMKELREQNEKLKKPMKLDQEEKEEQDIKEEQEEAKDKLQQNQKSGAKKNQKSAAKKMKQMSKGMQMQMQMSGQEQQMEDMEMLRQILDNLVDFSLGQEGLMKDFKGIGIDNPVYSGKLKKQSVLRENFIHIDDSLYALALRTPQITEQVTQKLTDIEFNIDKSLSRLAENQVVQGTANQQYTITGANDLAFLLSSVLDNMQNSMSSSGKGKSGANEFQLPDIIKKQEELNEQMQKGTEKGKKEGEKKGQEKGEQKGGQQDGNSGDKKGEKEGKNGKGKNGGQQNGEGDSQQQEDINGELYEIFKQQQELRNALADKLKEQEKGNKVGSGLLKKMEQVEQELLDKGFNERTLGKMLNLKHELLKMKEATFEQGEEERRESKTNQTLFEGQKRDDLQKAKQYFNTTEILNRQVLPLRQNYKKKVQDYFKKDND